ncbi:MAG: hypothetical protein ACREMY_30015, partial [bacterium]
MAVVEHSTSDEPKRYALPNLSLIVAPPRAVRVVLQAGETSSWSSDATIICSHEPIGYWAITNGVWSHVLGDENNGVLVLRHMFDIMSGLDPSVAAQRAVIENASPRSVAHREYCLLRVRRKVGFYGHSLEGTTPFVAALAEFPRHIVVSCKLRMALE